MLPRPVEALFPKLQRPAKALQDAFKRLSRAVVGISCLQDAFCCDVGAILTPQRIPLDLKNHENPFYCAQVWGCGNFLLKSPFKLDCGPSWAPFSERVGPPDD